MPEKLFTTAFEDRALIQTEQEPATSKNFIKKVFNLDSQTFILDNDGNVYSSGENETGQLGLGDTLDRDMSTKIEEISKIKDLCCAGDHTILLDFDGNVYTFGDDEYGYLGHGDDEQDKIVPTMIQNLPPIRSISADGSHNILIDVNNIVYGFGSDELGQLGFNDGSFGKKIPTLIPGLPGIKAAYCEYAYTILLDIENNIWACGENDDFRFKIPTQLSFGGDIHSVICNYDTIITINMEGECFNYKTKSYLKNGETGENLKAKVFGCNRFHKTKSSRNFINND